MSVETRKKTWKRFLEEIDLDVMNKHNIKLNENMSFSYGTENYVSLYPGEKCRITNEPVTYSIITDKWNLTLWKNTKMTHLTIFPEW